MNRSYSNKKEEREREEGRKEGREGGREGGREERKEGCMSWTCMQASLAITNNKVGYIICLYNQSCDMAFFGCP